MKIKPKGDNQWSELIPIENYNKVKGKHITELWNFLFYKIKRDNQKIPKLFKDSKQFRKWQQWNNSQTHTGVPHILYFKDNIWPIATKLHFYSQVYFLTIYIILLLVVFFCCSCCFVLLSNEINNKTTVIQLKKKLFFILFYKSKIYDTN